VSFFFFLQPAIKNEKAHMIRNPCLTIQFIVCFFNATRNCKHRWISVKSTDPFPYGISYFTKGNACCRSAKKTCRKENNNSGLLIFFISMHFFYKFNQRTHMPIFMDVHNAPGVKAKEVAEAHSLDLLHQEHFGCKCMTYWIDEARENVFCLIEAPAKEMVEALHTKAHGLVPHKVIEVNSEVVNSFLGRIYDPADAAITEDGLKVFHDSSFRILLVTHTIDPVLLRYMYGRENAQELFNCQHSIIRKQLALHGGRETEHAGQGFIISFSSAGQAVACALAIQKEMPGAAAAKTSFRMGIHAGDPVANTDQLFGDTIQLANCLCRVNGDSHIIIISSMVKELISKDYFQNGAQIFTLCPSDETALGQLYNQLESSWQDPDFNINDYCQTMAMSQSQLYRKTIALTGLSPNILLKEFRLEKAKELMKKQLYSVSQIAFECGFTSPSYFTKCFKNKYGLLPMDYLGLL
jgi:AraC-like DNA-binding protein